MKKWLKRIGLSVGGLLICLFLVARLYGNWSVWNTARTFPPPGKLIEVDGARTHLYCSGQGRPTVVLETGLHFEGSLGWGEVQAAVAQLRLSMRIQIL